MKLLVTGGAGYIGSIVAQQLLGAGHEVVVLDNLSRGHRSAVPDGARLAEVDLLDADAVRATAAEGFDGALHFAAFALVSESVAQPQLYYRNNVVGSLNLLDALRAADVERLVFSSTCAVYGEPEVVPMDEATAAEGFDGALHFAAFALVSESVAQPQLYYRNNVVGSLNLLDALRAADVERLVFSSTCAVYGEPEVVPMDEATATRPVNAYGASKLAVDGMIGDECRAHGLGAVSLRYFNVAGASGCLGEDHHPETHLIPNVLRAAQGINDVVQIFGTDYPTPDGTAVRDYIHIEDLASAHLLALEGARAGEHRIFNLGNGNGFSVREVIDAARAVTGLEIPVREAPRRPGDPPMLVAASGRIRAELGWEPRKPALAEMVGDAWAFAQSHPQGYAGAPAAPRA